MHGASTGGTPSGLHGTNIESVKVDPAGTELSTTKETTVHISTELAFVVAVKNGGDSQEVQIQVTLDDPDPAQLDREDRDDRRHRPR